MTDLTSKEYRARYRDAYRKRNRERGLCFHCAKPSAPYSQCEDCRAKVRERRNRRFPKTCPHCGIIVPRWYKYCDDYREQRKMEVKLVKLRRRQNLSNEEREARRVYMRQRDAKRIAKGLCIRCSNPRDPEASVCAPCLEKGREKARASWIKNRDKRRVASLAAKAEAPKFKHGWSEQADAMLLRMLGSRMSIGVIATTMHRTQRAIKQRLNKLEKSR